MAREVSLPLSKSIALRVMTLNAACRVLGLEPSCIPALPDAEDVEGMTRALQALEKGEKSVYIGEGGAPIRFFTALTASTEGADITVAASEGLMKRPMAPLLEALRSAGASIECLRNALAPPLHIVGRNLSPLPLAMNPGVSSQYISALMMAATIWESPLILSFEGGDAVSRPYIEMTRKIMERYGCEIVADAQGVSVAPGMEGAPQSFPIEGDWSAASYFYEMSALMADPDKDIRIRNLTPAYDSLQGDSAAAGMFLRLGVETSYHEDGSATLHYKPGVTGEGKLMFDLRDTPDLAPALAVACALCGREFLFTNVAHLRHKETDRMAALHAELLKLGIETQCGADTFGWDGSRLEIAKDIIPEIKTYSDHRMAMAFAPAAIRFGSIRIEHPGVVGKSFPTYWEAAEICGLTLQKSTPCGT